MRGFNRTRGMILTAHGFLPRQQRLVTADARGGRERCEKLRARKRTSCTVGVLTTLQHRSLSPICLVIPATNAFSGMVRAPVRTLPATCARVAAARGHTISPGFFARAAYKGIS